MPGNWRVASKNRGNHNDYRGPLLGKINLSQLTAINAPHFAVIDLPEYLHWGTDYGGRSIIEPHRPRELTIKTTLPQHQIHYQPFLFHRLSGLTVSFGFEERKFLKSLPPGLAVNLRRLSLLGVNWPLTKLVEQLVVPLTTTTKVEKGVITINDRLEELHVAWDDHNYREKFTWILKTGLNRFAPTSSPVVRFPALTTLHLVKSTLLHR